MFGWRRGRKNKECCKHSHNCSEKKHGKGFGYRHHGRLRCINLDEAAVGQRYRVIANPDKKTMEMGIYHSGVITVHKNEENNPNIVVGVGESRYIIPRELAKRILIK